MPRKAKTKSAEESKGAKPAIPGPPMVTVVRTGTAEKLSPRGEGALTYQVGRRGDKAYLRISGNESSGRFSREWVEVSAIRKALAGLPEGAEEFKGAVALRPAWKGQSSCNGGFGAAILKSEGVFAASDDPKRKGMLRLASPGALDEWEKEVLAMDAPEGAEQVPLNPPKPKPPFAKKKEAEGEAGQDEGNEAGAEPNEQEDASDGDGNDEAGAEP
ncbi:MAG: hypothetical protein ACOCX4_09640 [Planctomycetota bacterium]